jgi:hypothetical protein
MKAAIVQGVNDKGHTMTMRRLLGAVLASVALTGLVPISEASAAAGPNITNPATTYLKVNQQFTVKGTATPGALVVLHYHKQGTPFSDYSIVRSVRAASSGAWSRTSLLNVDYRVFATVGIGNPHSKTVLFTRAAPTTFRQAITAIPGLTHYYPLDAANQARDVVGNVHGINHGATFGANGATFNGKSYIELPDNNDFSAATTGQMTVVVFNTITNWKGAGASEYVHWMGKGVAGAHEWTFRHYVAGGSGEAASRQNRTSFYHFNPAGGLGAGSYFQDPDGATERMVTGMVDTANTQMWKNGVLRDTDSLAGYSIRPKNTATPVRLGTRDMATGYLVGRLRSVAFYNRKLSAAELQTLFAARARSQG